MRSVLDPAPASVDYSILGLEPLPDRGSAVEHATLEIRRAILDGRMPPGTIAPIGILSQQLGVSAIPVREALRALESDGLIMLRPNRRAVVAPLTLSELEEIYRARRVFELEIVRRAAPASGPGPDVVQRLRRMLDELSDRKLDPGVRRRAHKEFHYELLRPAATQFDFRVLDLLWNSSDRYIRLIFSEMMDDTVHETHVPLIEAAQTRDGEAATMALKKHLDNGEAILSALLRDRPELR
jgi:DNA-binding GntR family transcriptional regulator